jgi:NADH:ubiquinone oxidoreductase subunit K
MARRPRYERVAKDGQRWTTGGGKPRPYGGTVLGPDLPWYFAVAAILFATGTLGVLLRRSPLIVLLSLELMLNGGNLALVGFSRYFGEGDGQIFALSVMAVAAAEVCVGLGLIVAISRRKLDLDVDAFQELRG